VFTFALKLVKLKLTATRIVLRLIHPIALQYWESYPLRNRDCETVERARKGAYSSRRC
jgi:hypothetical protein